MLDDLINSGMEEAVGKFLNKIQNQSYRDIDFSELRQSIRNGTSASRMNSRVSFDAERGVFKINQRRFLFDVLGVD